MRMYGPLVEVCDHPAQPVNLTTGTPMVRTSDARRAARPARLPDMFVCGPLAVGFAPAVAQATPQRRGTWLWRLLAVALVVGAVLLLTACGGGGDDGQPDQQQRPPNCALQPIECR